MASAASLLFILAFPFYGIQTVWSTELAFAPPYLLSLGIPRDLMSLILLAAPLSGLFVQPIIGHYADHSKSPYGRRRPYMFVGTILAMVSMLVLGYGKPVVELILGVNSNLGKAIIIALAVISLYVVDFAVNAVMAVDRALLVDVLGPELQERANAWGSLAVQIGQVVGYWIGSIELPKIFPWLGSTQIQVLSATTVVSLLVPHALVMFRVKEKPLSRTHPDQSGSELSVADMVKKLWKAIGDFPRAVHQTFAIQFWCWSSQFPALIYTTVYIGDIYRSTRSDGDSEAGTRAGSRAMFYEALVGLVVILSLPRLLVSKRFGPTALWGRNASPRVFLSATWAVSQALSALVMFCISLSRSVRSATVLVAMNGFCITVNHWVPFALVGEAILLEAHQKDDARTQYYEEVDEAMTRAEAPLLDSPGSPLSAGAAMGILNAFICVPQFVIIGLSSILFAILEPNRTISVHEAARRADGSPLGKDERSTTLIIIFRVAAMCGVVAFYLASKLTQDFLKVSTVREVAPAHEYTPSGLENDPLTA